VEIGSDAMIGGVLVTHGRVGEALRGAVEHFLGEQPALEVISNDGRSAAEIREVVSARIAGLGDDDALILFADLAGGSCETTCRILAADHPRCVGLSGVNLPMLLEFCHYRERVDLETLVARVVRKGRDGVDRCRTEGP